MPQRHHPDGKSPFSADSAVERLRDQQVARLLEKYLRSKMKDSDEETEFLNRYWQLFEVIADRMYFRLEDLPYFTGRCLPGTKIAVRPDGSFHLCERINEQFPIGNLKTGLEFVRIAEVMQKYDQQVTGNCQHCPAVRFCQVCYALACTQDGFDAKQLCDALLEQIPTYLRGLCTVLEANPDAYEAFNQRSRLVDLTGNW